MAASSSIPLNVEIKVGDTIVVTGTLDVPTRMVPRALEWQRWLLIHALEV